MNTNKPACHPRRRYQTRDTASAASAAIVSRGGQQRLPEPCPHCNGWHLR